MRTISQIYSEAIYTRNNYLQITELDSGRTKSKMSVMNLMTYVMSVLIYSYETILDVFQVNIAKLLSQRINGTPAWYVTMAMKFQFNPITGKNDPYGVNENTLNLEYETIDATHRIITKAAYQENPLNDSITLKVCKDNVDEQQINNGNLYMQLSVVELAAFKDYIKSIKFVGAKVYCVSLPADIVTIKCNSAYIYYDDTYISEESVLEDIKQALISYSKSLAYNSFIYYQSIIDAIQSVNYVQNIDAGITVEVRHFNVVSGTYNAATQIIGQYRPHSGYIGFVDENGDSTINTTNLHLTPIS